MNIGAAGKTVLFLLVALLTLACSEEKLSIREDFSSPEKTYRFWMETAERGDMDNNIRCMTEPSRRVMDSQLRQMDEFMKRLNENMKIFKRYTLTEQKIMDEKAIVVLKGPKGDVMIVPLKKEAEGWKIDLISLFGGMG